MVRPLKADLPAPGPWPARAAERLGGGAGVMLDDVATGVWGAALVLGGRALGWL